MGLFSRKTLKQPVSNGLNSSPMSPTEGTAKSPLFSKHGGISPTSSTSMSVPEVPLPKAPDPNLDPVAYLRSIHAVRRNSQRIYDEAKKNQLKHFTVNMDELTALGKYVVSIVKRDYAPNYSKIPAYSRWQHFEAGGRPRIDQLLSSWPSSVKETERTKRLIDLFFIAVLLDADAGTKWKYKSKESGKLYNRTEGLAIACLEMFKAGRFSSDPNEPHQVNSKGLKALDRETLKKGFQVTDINCMSGLEGRTELLQRFAEVLEDQTIYGVEARPGNVLDYLLSHPSTSAHSVPLIPLYTFWTVLTNSLSPIWPAKYANIDGVKLGDAWTCSLMPSHPVRPWENIIPFHKVIQWLVYSLMVPMTKLLNVYFTGTELLTAIPEYRNGGLLIDTGILTLKAEDQARGLAQYHQNAQIKGQPSIEVVPLFSVDDDVIVEWRAFTVCFLDDLLGEVNRLLGFAKGGGLSLAQMLEAGTWKGGREIAEVSRPNTKEPPILVFSDGVYF